MWACKNYDGEFLLLARPPSFAPSEAKRSPGTAPFQHAHLVLRSLGAGLHLVLACSATLYMCWAYAVLHSPKDAHHPCTVLAWSWGLTSLRWLQAMCSQTSWPRDTARWG